MYVWEVEFEQHWDNDEDGEFPTSVDYTISAADYNEALKKGKKLALSSEYTDEEDDGDGKTHRVTEVRLISVKRGVELDA